MESVQFVREGCWKNVGEDRVFPDLLMTDIDKSSLKYSGVPAKLSWNDFPGYLEDLAKRCAMKARETNEKYFGLENWGM